jgi:hypothetical protein
MTMDKCRIEKRDSMLRAVEGTSQVDFGLVTADFSFCCS